MLFVIKSGFRNNSPVGLIRALNAFIHWKYTTS